MRKESLKPGGLDWTVSMVSDSDIMRHPAGYISK